MASTNAFFPAGLAAIGNGDIVLTTDTLDLICVDDTYVFNAAHDTISDLSSVTIGSGSAVAGSRSMVGRTLVTDQAVQTIAAVPVDVDEVGAIVMYETGTGILLHAWFNTGEVPLVTVTDGGDVEVEFVEETDTGLFGIVRI